MKYVWQFVIIIFFSFAGDGLHALLPLPVPGSVYGIVLLFCALQFGMLKVDSIREVSSFLLDLMPVLLVPAAVAVVDLWDFVSEHCVAYVTILVLTTLFVMFCSGWCTQLLLRIKKK